MQYLKTLERLCRDFENVSELLKVMGRSAEDGAEYKDVAVWRQFSHEMFGALTFLGIVVRERSDDLWSLLSEMEEWSEVVKDDKAPSGAERG